MAQQSLIVDTSSEEYGDSCQCAHDVVWLMTNQYLLNTLIVLMHLTFNNFNVVHSF